MSFQPKSIFRPVPDYKNLHLYQKSEVLVLLTDVFCRRFLPAHGDRTVDQMNQAARSGKQNIVEGSEAALTRSETEVKLVNVGRASLQELREDYEDYLKKHSLPLWDKGHPRFDNMLAFCRSRNDYADYRHLAETLPAEEFCNMDITLCASLTRCSTPTCSIWRNCSLPKAESKKGCMLPAPATAKSKTYVSKS